MYAAALASLSLAAGVLAQQVGTQTAEVHPALTWSQCKAGGACTSVTGSVVLDSNWRWLHQTSSTTNCYTGNTWDATLCPNPTTCAANCALDGADYEGTYGITSSGDQLTLGYVTNGPYSTNIGSRVYLMANSTNYEMFNPLNMEFSFDVDVSNLGCGLNGALYFVQMDSDGGLARFPTNKAGANYGTGYCDSQCPQDIKFINGLANLNNWTASATDPNAGTGEFGTCCSEMDVWEANNNAAAFTPHPCSVEDQTECSGVQCGSGSNRYDGVCDPDGCDFNSYRMGDETFYGAGMTVDTTKKFSVVTQFLTSDGTATGSLSEIRRVYVQNGVVIPNSMSSISTMAAQYDSVSDDFCTDQKTAFGDTNRFAAMGGIEQMGASFAKGVVLVLSVWSDDEVHMLWLDSDYPTTSATTSPGVARGTCATTSGVPATLESTVPNSSVAFSNIKFGPINSTYTA